MTDMIVKGLEAAPSVAVGILILAAFLWVTNWCFWFVYVALRGPGWNARSCLFVVGGFLFEIVVFVLLWRALVSGSSLEPWSETSALSAVGTAVVTLGFRALSYRRVWTSKGTGHPKESISSSSDDRPFALPHHLSDEQRAKMFVVFFVVHSVVATGLLFVAPTGIHLYWTVIVIRNWVRHRFFPAANPAAPESSEC